MLYYRKATMDDVPQIHQLISIYTSQGLMLRRPIMQIYESVRDFVVTEDNGLVIATSGLHMLWNDLAEIRSLSVHPNYIRQGIGRRLVEFLVDEAKALRVMRLFAFTYNQPFFERCKFTVIKKDLLPQKVWKECVYCDKFHNCDETAVIRYLANDYTSAGEEEIPLVDVPRWKVD